MRIRYLHKNVNEEWLLHTGPIIVLVCAYNYIITYISKGARNVYVQIFFLHWSEDSFLISVHNYVPPIACSLAFEPNCPENASPVWKGFVHFAH